MILISSLYSIKKNRVKIMNSSNIHIMRRCICMGVGLTEALRRF